MKILNIFKIIIDDLKNYPLVRDYRVTRANLELNHRIKDGKSETDAMNLGYNKVRAVARWRKAVQEIPGLEERKVHLERKLKERGLF